MTAKVMKSRGFTNSGGNDIGAVAWYSGNSGSVTREVGGKSPNELGLCDMSGNVWEWCYDWYDEGYYAKTQGATNPVNKSQASRRVFRGGSWSDGAWNCRVANRIRSRPVRSNDFLGFRVCLASGF